MRELFILKLTFHSIRSNVILQNAAFFFKVTCYTIIVLTRIFVIVSATSSAV